MVRWALLALIIASGGVLRAAYNANTLIDDPIRADAAYYLIYAHNLLYYSTFSKDNRPPPEADSYWAPGYPFFLAGVIKLSGETDVTQAYDAVLFAQLILGVGTIFLTYLVAAAFLPGYWSLLAPALVAFSPHLVSTASYALTETLFCFLLLLSTLALILAAKHNRATLWLLAGCAYALTYLVNPVSLLLPVILALGWVGCARTRAESVRPLRPAVLLLLPLALAVGGWSLRNQISVPEGAPTSSGRLLTNLASGIYPDYHEKWRASKMDSGAGTFVPGSDVESYGDFLGALTGRLVAEPLDTVSWYAVRKPLLLWSWDIKVGHGDIYIYKVFYSLYQTSGIALASYAIMRSLHPWLLAAAVLGLIWLVVGRGRGVNSMAAVVLYTTVVYISLVYIATQAAPRYSIPLRPELYLCASFFLWRAAAAVARLRAASGDG